ncbi:nuclear transport factor 2 family protein [Pseudanabaena sp. UWO310]|uniref:nuclear transport factor 2 family protein n=1 Tax=Pseudanabaena sp. UWO310 TaxID=2480795 RepID=UPI00115BCE63|nr:nuclear transport factor 2 family protein [Pseudanabaena sp. UWO310]TYQ25508.1 ethyl tert-butyl ether degradation protein EthD [Pseudanabaena sp. UWO310]
MTVLDQYFELSDRAREDDKAFDELVELFAEEAEVQPAGARKVVGKDAISQLYRQFFQTYSGMQRVWTTRRTENGLEAIWAIAGKRDSGELFAMQGRHIAEVDAQGKIYALEVHVSKAN